MLFRIIDYNVIIIPQRYGNFFLPPKKTAGFTPKKFLTKVKIKLVLGVIRLIYFL